MTIEPLSSSIAEHLKLVYAYGQSLGNHGDVFSKVGDSITVSNGFLHPIGKGFVTLGEYSHLQPVIDHFSARRIRDGNSFSTESLAAGVGWSAWAVFDPAFSNPTYCAPSESPLACEYRHSRPAFALIMFGTNDVGYRSVSDYKNDLVRIVELSEGMGVIPILSTIPNRPDLPEQVKQFNTVVQEIAQTHHLPLWDYYGALQDLPNNGLTWDNVHPSSPDVFAALADFRAPNLSYGYVVRNLTALQVLAQVWQDVK